ncbi:reverse transcriptase [Phytophthora megakarya]|uniref:Reverse transcriptase n=1 Tax=Phytophthora megakarya TaxID=4795 RepID=A0A225V5L1_9STRA|nr:reverse transcriptase [Phytophthora megakarya]
MSAGGIKEHSSMAGPGRNTSESGIHKKKRRHKHKTLRKSRSRTETLQVMSWKRFAKDLYDGRIDQLCNLLDRERMTSEAEELRQLFAGSATESEDTLKHRDVLTDEIPAELPQDKGIQHEIDLVPGTKYCLTWQWPLPWEHVKTINDFFESRRKAGQVGNQSPRTAHQHADPRQDVIIDSISKSTIYSALDLRDGFYQILMRLKNAPATFNSRAVNENTDVEMHKEHLRELLGLMRKQKLYANLNKCIFGASEIPVLGCLVGKNGVRPGPEKVRVINEWPTPSNVKELWQFLGLATYLCKYVDNYAGKIRPLSQLLKKEAAWERIAECQQAFDAVNPSLTEAPILAVAAQDRLFHGELLAMKYALAKFRVYLLGNTPSVVYTDHASLRTAVKSPHISQRMARWLSFLAEYNFRTVDVNRIGVARTYTPSSSLLDEVKAAYAHDAFAKQLIEFLSAPSDKSHDNADRIVVPNDPDLRSRIMYEYHDVHTAGHPGREKTYSLLTRDFYWNHQYKWVRKYVRTCDVCQRVKPAPHSQAPLQPLPTPSECWDSVSMDFVFGLPRDSRWKTGIVIFVDRFSKLVHLAAVAAEVTSVQTARLFVDMVFKHHGMPNNFVSDRDPRFKARFWQEVFTLLGTQFSMSTADHPQTDGQTERVNRVLVDLLKSYAQSFHNWSDYLPMAEFAINNTVHASTGHTPFFVNAMRHPRRPSTLGAVDSSLSGGIYGCARTTAEYS